MAIKNILEDSELEKKEIKRHDFKIQTVIKIAQNYNNNNIKFKWMSYEDFYILEKEISLNLYNKEENKDNINEILNNINGIIEDNIYNENEKKNDEEDNEVDSNNNICEDNILNDKNDFNEINDNEVEIHLGLNGNSSKKLAKYLDLDNEINIADILKVNEDKLNIDNNNHEDNKKLEVINDIDNTKKPINYPKRKKRSYNEIKKDSSEIYFKGEKNLKHIKNYLFIKIYLAIINLF